MSKMSKYCKAYELRDLRAYPRWSERAAEPSTGPDAPAPLEQDSIVYIHDNYTVTQGIMLDEQVVFDAIDDEWKRFCEEQLDFRVPDFATESAA